MNNLQILIRFFIFLSSLLIVACGSVSEVVALSEDSFVISSSGIVGNGSASAEEIKALSSATLYCQKKSLQLNVINIEKVDPMFGRAPSSTITFRCADKNLAIENTELKKIHQEFIDITLPKPNAKSFTAKFFNIDN